MKKKRIRSSKLIEEANSNSSVEEIKNEIESTCETAKKLHIQFSNSIIKRREKQLEKKS